MSYYDDFGSVSPGKDYHFDTEGQKRLNDCKFYAFSKDCKNILDLLCNKYKFYNVSIEEKKDFYKEISRLLKQFKENHLHNL